MRKSMIWIILWPLLLLSIWADAWSQQLPNLTPYQPSGWSDKIVATNKTGCTSTSCTDSSPLLPTDTLYVDSAVINNGSASTSVRFYTQIYVDGVSAGSWYYDPPLRSELVCILL